jgi:DNA mismatch repair ATPase MutS
MHPEIYYNERIQQLQKELSSLLKKKLAFGWVRFAAVVLIIGAIYFFWYQSLVLLISSSTILIIVFVRLVFIDITNKNAIQHVRHLIQINEDELKALQHNYFHFAEGNEFIQAEHSYASDVDIFGRASLFQYINRTTSEMGSSTLAKWLSNPADVETIRERQAAVKDLVQKTQWQQELQATGKEWKIQTDTKVRLQGWLSQPDVFTKFKPWRWLRYFLPAIILSVVALYIFEQVSLQIVIFFVLVFAAITYNINTKVSLVHEQLSKMVDELDVLSASIHLLEKTSFTASLLIKTQQEYTSNNNSASAELTNIKKILERLDLRYNLMLEAPLDILLLWSLQQVISLEKWKSKNKENVIRWFEILGEFEALNSLSILSFNHPQWCLPLLHDKHFCIEGKQVGHPLIAINKRVNNDVTIERSGELMLVTGSNMAGKSTYLRSIGINIVLAMAGAPVCAEYFALSPVKLISSMRITDNLEESTSTFYAELKKLRIIIEEVNKGEKIFILLDEILRGTNSFDRHTGSVALLKQLIRHNAVGIIATHDVELGKLKETYPENILNYHFDAQINDGELYFDYLLKPGICKSLNASILMKKIGIEL